MNVSKATLLLAGLIKAHSVDADKFDPIFRVVDWDGDMDNVVEVPQGILGGEIIEQGSRPWLVPVVGSRGFCGGSLISPRAVMTAAHCVLLENQWNPTVYIDFHRHSWSNNTGVKRVFIGDSSQCDGDIVYHPYWNEYTIENDVAIVFLPEPITDITPVVLNEDKNVPEAGAQLDASGWGVFDISVDTLSYEGPQAATLSYVGPNEDCEKKPYRYPEGSIQDSVMCAIGETPKSICFGDSGGPITLLNSNVQVGISSFVGSSNCYTHRFPNGLTRVSKVADWVKETVCSRVGELCKESKAGKMSKISKGYRNKCVPVPTEAPTDFPPTLSPTVTAHPVTPYPTYTPTSSLGPTVTAQPFTPYPTYFPTSSWPTWMPTEAPNAEKD